ncbi:MAG: MaoC family dehydratase [bacterium]
MSLTFPLPPQEELAPGSEVNPGQARFPEYGRYLEDFAPGQVLRHPRGFTVDAGLAKAFAGAFQQANPLYLNSEYATAHGFPRCPVCPQLVFNLVLSLGVQNDSEKAMANLGYYRARFVRPVYPDDTIRSLTRVRSRRERGEGKPGIVHLETLGLNQWSEVVLQYERKIMVMPRRKGGSPGPTPAPTPVSGDTAGPSGAAARERSDFPWQESPPYELPVTRRSFPAGLTGQGTYLESFRKGDIVVHANGRTITDEHMGWTAIVGNTHPLHTDRVYSTGLSGAMSGEPIVYGGLVFAWLEGLASRDVSENALWDLGFTEGYHTQPVQAGDTVAALTRVLDIAPAPAALPSAGILTVQLVGVKNMTAAKAFEQFGADLFVKENDKKDRGKEKIGAKIFEIERRLLLKRRPSL